MTQGASMKLWHILGAGSIGCLMSYLLGQQGFTTQLITRRVRALPDNLSVVQSNGATISLPLNLTLVEDQQPIHQLLVTTKAPDVTNALASIRHRLIPGARLLFLHNGMGPQQMALEQYPEQQIFWGSVTHGAYFKNPSTLVHAGQGDVITGSPVHQNRPNDWPEGWLWADDIEYRLWQKLAVNALINPLTALHQCQNGELLNNETLIHQMQQLATEVELVAKACGIDLKDSYQLAAQIAKKTGNNRSSMLQDRLNNRVTEIDQINGYIAQMGQLHNFPTPLNDKIVQDIHALTP
jgi:2-dehydropantoate 2-reductase